MPSLKDLKNRIASVKSTRKITKAMQMVAAAKLRRAQDAAATAPRLLSGTGSDQTHLLVVMTAERGLCGGFNGNIAKLARNHANALIAEGKTVKILTVGKKGFDIATLFFARFENVVSQHPTALQVIPAKFDDVAEKMRRPNRAHGCPPWITRHATLVT